MRVPDPANIFIYNPVKCCPGIGMNEEFHYYMMYLIAARAILAGRGVHHRVIVAARE
jgi:hypothetical protein